MPRILLVVTSCSKMGDVDTGYALEEAAAPYCLFQDAGYDVDIASPEGGLSPIDPISKAEDYQSDYTRRFEADEDVQKKLRESTKLSEVVINDSTSYAAVFFVGGVGTAVDYPENAAVQSVLEKVHGKGGVVGAVCHGPSAFVGAKDESGEALVSGKKMTGLSTAEWEMVGIADKVPFMLESKFPELGAEYNKGEPFKPFAVVDGRVVTGQNLMSSELTAKMVLETLAAVEKAGEGGEVTVQSAE